MRLKSIIAAALCAVGLTTFAKGPEGSEGNPWKVGATDADSVVAWTNGTGKLTVEGAGEMKGWSSKDYSARPWYGHDKTITSVEVRGNVTSIGSYAFYSEGKATNVTIAGCVTDIGDGAFSWCTSLTRVEIPSSVTNIVSYAFYSCTNLETVTFAEPSAVKSIGYGAFACDSSLAGLEVPASVTSIGGGAFVGVPNVTVNAGMEAYEMADGLLIDTRTKTVVSGTADAEVTIPSSMTGIDECAFYYSSALCQVAIPASVTNIGEYAFYLCGNLSNVTFETGSRLSAIGEGAFCYCFWMGEIEIPANVKTIGGSAFYSCSALSNVTVWATTPPELGGWAFGDCAALTTIYVPYGTGDDYRVADGWSAYADIIAELPAEAPSVTIGEVKSVEPWDGAKGTITVDYSLGGIDAEKTYKVAFDITANGETKGVTNAAAKLTSGKQAVKSINTTELFGKETRAENAKVKVSLIGATPKATAVQLWVDGPYWAISNFGTAEEGVPAEYGALYKFDKATNEVAKLGNGWRLPTPQELTNFTGKAYCTNVWTVINGIKGRQFFGVQPGYEDKSIFLSAAGCDWGYGRNKAEVDCSYWSSMAKDSRYAWRLYDDHVNLTEREWRMSVRLVRDAPEFDEEVVAFAEQTFRLGSGSEPEPEPEPETGSIFPEGDGGKFVPAAKGTVTYNGAVIAADGVAGTVELKMKKPNKNGEFDITATVKTAAGQKLSFKAKKVKAPADGGPLTVGLEAANKTATGRALAVTLEGNSLKGAFDGAAIDGASDAFKDKTSARAAEIAPFVGTWTGAFTSGLMSFSAKIAKTGKATVKVILPDGKTVSCSAKAEVGADVIAVPVTVQKSEKDAVLTFGFRLAFGMVDGTVVCQAADVSPLKVADKRTGAVIESTELKFLAADMVTMTSAEFKALGVAVDPALTEQLGPMTKNQLKFAASTGLISGSLKFGKVSGKVSGIVIGGIGFGTVTVKIAGVTAAYEFCAYPPEMDPPPDLGVPGKAAFEGGPVNLEI